VKQTTNIGTVVAVRGSIIDIRFEHRLPHINTLLRAGGKEGVPKILHRAPCPVLIYQHCHEKPPFDIRQIVAPTDLSEESLKALKYTVGLAEQLGARVTIVRIYDETVSDAVSAAESADRLRNTLEDMRARKVLGDTYFEWGQPNSLIIGLAERLQADLMVLSTHTYHLLHHLIFGSDAENILRHAPCPVLIFREKGTR
jgi:universal stress protein A